MQVAAQIEEAEFIAIGGGKSQSFKIAQSAHAIQILSSTLYSDKPLAVAREYICNAVDAHRKIGSKEPIRVNVDKNVFVVEDKGPGIPHEKIGDVFCTYFASTKTDDESQIGGFGLGCKAAFALSDDFTVINKHGGKKAIYAISKGNEESGGMPVFKKMVETDTDETGLTVKVPFAEDQLRNLDRSILRVLRDGGFHAIYGGNLFEEVDWSQGYKSGYSLIERLRHHDNSALLVRYGDILYPIANKPDYSNSFAALCRMLYNNIESRVFVLCAQPGEISITPSREALSYDETTIKWLATKLSQLENQLTKRVKARQTKMLEVALRVQGDSFYQALGRSLNSLDLVSDNRRYRPRNMDEIINYVAAHTISDDGMSNEGFTTAFNKVFHHHKHAFNRELKRAGSVYNLINYTKAQVRARFVIPLLLRILRRLDISLDHLIARPVQSWEDKAKYVSFKSKRFYREASGNISVVKNKTAFSNLLAEQNKGYWDRRTVPESSYIITTDGLPSQKVDELIVELARVKVLRLYALHELQPTWQSVSKRFRRKESVGFYHLVLSSETHRSGSATAHMLLRPVNPLTSRPRLPERVEDPVAYVPLPPVRGRGDLPAVILGEPERGWVDTTAINKAFALWEKKLGGSIVVPFTEREAKELKARKVPSLVSVLLDSAKEDTDREQFIRSCLFQSLKNHESFARAVYTLCKNDVDVFDAAFEVPYSKLFIEENATTEIIRTIVSTIGDGFFITESSETEINELAALKAMYAPECFTAKSEDERFEAFKTEAAFESVMRSFKPIYEIIDNDRMRYEHGFSDEARDFLFNSIRKLSKSDKRYKENKRRLLGVAEKKKKVSSAKASMPKPLSSNQNTPTVDVTVTLEIAA